jgi:hypothetical protein
MVFALAFLAGLGGRTGSVAELADSLGGQL